DLTKVKFGEPIVRIRQLPAIEILAVEKHNRFAKLDLRQIGGRRQGRGPLARKLSLAEGRAVGTALDRRKFQVVAVSGSGDRLDDAVFSFAVESHHDKLIARQLHAIDRQDASAAPEDAG